MKSLYLFLLICFVVSCAGSKKVVTSNENTTSTHKKDNKRLDSINETPSDTISIKDSLHIKSSEEDTKNQEEPKEETPEVESKSSKKLHQTWNELLNDYVSDEGNVDYKSFKKNRQKLFNYINN